MRINTMHRAFKLVLSLILLGAFTGLPAHVSAETKKADKSAKADEKDKEELPNDGVLSRSVTTGYQSKNVDLPWGYDKDATKGESPISGSVSKVTDREWKMRVFNNSKDTYSVDLKVTQYDKRGTSLKSDSFSYTMKGGSEVTRSVATTASTADAQLKMVRWKNLTEKQKAKEKAAEGQGSSGAATSQPGVAKKK